jgi:hypothetical protein
LRQRKGSDEEWLKLYAFQEQYRKEHNVTASHILKELGLSLSLATFLYGNRFAPGAHCGPLGLQLRQNCANWLMRTLHALLWVDKWRILKRRASM